MTFPLAVEPQIGEIMAEATKRPWYVGAQNDILYIIDKPPRPVPTDNPADIPGLTVVAKLLASDFTSESANAALIVTAVNQHDALLKCAEALKELKGLFEHVLQTPGYGTDQNSRDEAACHLEKAADALALLEKSNG
jgi:hypothetical protein